MLFLLLLIAFIAGLYLGGTYQVKLKTVGGFNVTYVKDGVVNNLL